MMLGNGNAITKQTVNKFKPSKDFPAIDIFLFISFQNLHNQILIFLVSIFYRLYPIELTYNKQINIYVFFIINNNNILMVMSQLNNNIRLIF